MVYPVTNISVPIYSPDMVTKITMMENLLYIIDKEAQLRLLQLNYAQKLLFSNWSHRMILLKSRQLGISTAILAYFFIEAMITPGLSVAIVSHEDRAARRLVDKIDTFHKHLPDDLKVPMFHDSDLEKTFPNGSTLYVGTAGMRAFGHGDTVHRALVSEEAYYVGAKKLLTGLGEAIPMSGYLIRESTPLGDFGYFYHSVQDCLEKKSDFKLLPFYWWYGEDYHIPRNSGLVREEERGELAYTAKEISLMLEKNLTEDQIRWARWKERNMGTSDEERPFPQEYISDLESCFMGAKDKVFDDVDNQLLSMSLKARDPIRVEGILEIWKEPEPGAKYVFWIDPAGGEGATDSDPHDGVILKIHAGGLEHVASICSKMEQKAFAYRVAEIGTKYNHAMMVVERNGIGKGVLNYLVNDISYKNLYPERKPNGELSGKWGWNTDHANKAMIAGDTLAAVKRDSVITYDRKLIRQLRALVYKDGKIASPIHDDRAMAFMGAVSISAQARGYSVGNKLAVSDYVTFGRN